jgi:hypothetical protein
MKAVQLTETHEQNGTRAHNGKQISATDDERVETLPDPPDGLWDAGKERWKLQGQAMIDAGVLVTRDLAVLQDHCELYQQKQAWLGPIGKLVKKNGGDMPLGNEDVERAVLHLTKLNNPYNITCELLGIGALARTKRGTEAKKKGTAGGVTKRAKPVPTKRTRR